MLYSTCGERPSSARAIARTSSGVMWRRSARGGTVMPGAPAATHTSAASTTLGTHPPREFRSVATLLMLMERRTIQHFLRSPKVFFDDVDNLLSPAANLVLVPPLEHHAQQRFRA